MRLHSRTQHLCFCFSLLCAVLGGMSARRLGRHLIKKWSKYCDPNLGGDCPYPFTTQEPQADQCWSNFEWAHLFARTFDMGWLNATPVPGAAAASAPSPASGSASSSSSFSSVTFDQPWNLVAATTQTNLAMHVQENWIRKSFPAGTLRSLSVQLDTKPLCNGGRMVHGGYPLWFVRLAQIVKGAV